MEFEMLKIKAKWKKMQSYSPHLLPNEELFSNQQGSWL
jgi:hypothetical protein